jgi:hypothetical protein
MANIGRKKSGDSPVMRNERFVMPGLVVVSEPHFDHSVVAKLAGFGHGYLRLAILLSLPIRIRKSHRRHFLVKQLCDESAIL